MEFTGCEGKLAGDRCVVAVLGNQCPVLGLELDRHGQEARLRQSDVEIKRDFSHVGQTPIALNLDLRRNDISDQRVVDAIGHRP